MPPRWSSTFCSLACYFALLTIPFTRAAVQKRSTIILTNGTGSIQSPNYPNDYPPNVDFRWLIVAPYRKQIRLRVNEFVLERFRDLLQLYDIWNFHQNAVPFAEITGRCTLSNPDECLENDIITKRNVVRIRFISDYYNQYQGFNLSYSVE